MKSENFWFCKKVIHTGVSVSTLTPKGNFWSISFKFMFGSKTMQLQRKLHFSFVFDENSYLIKSNFSRNSFNFWTFLLYSAFVNNDTSFFECFYIRQNRGDKINQLILSGWINHTLFFQLKFLIVFPSLSFSTILSKIDFFFKYLNNNLEKLFVFHYAKSTQIEKFVILYPNLAILVNFEIPKLLVKIFGTFLVTRYEKVLIYFEA